MDGQAINITDPSILPINKTATACFCEMGTGSKTVEVAFGDLDENEQNIYTDFADLVNTLAG